ncbi:MAG: SMP-30/gluconolactonase/LRE family protein [Planctomycetes bacterium]|nr:SMP-30/gluconolactonase/LRE family protein [Planctomycetota bacterium]
MFHLRHVSTSAAAALVLLAAPLSFAHETNVLDLERLEDRVFDALEDPSVAGRPRAAYTSLLKTFGKSSRGLVSRDLVKVLAAARACDRALSGDVSLDLLVDAAAAEASLKLAGESDDLGELARRIFSASDRRAVVRTAERGATARDRGVVSGANGGRAEMLRRFHDAAREFESARSKASRAFAKQRRRPSPGQPLPKGPAGTIDTYAGNALRAYDGEDLPALRTALYWPLDVAVSPFDGLLYICDANNHRVRRVDADGRLRTVAGAGELGASEGPAAEAKFHHPSSIAFDPGDGALFVAGWHSDVVHRCDPSAQTVTFVAGTDHGFAGDGGPAVSAQLGFPVGAVFDAAGNWYVADQANARIRRVDATTGVITTIAGTGDVAFGGDGGDATAASFALDDGENLNAGGRICLSPDGARLYVADTLNRRVRAIDIATGTVSTIAGTGAVGSDGDGGSATAATLSRPSDVDCDADGNVYVADVGSHTIRRIDPATGVISRFAGDGTRGFRGDGGPALTARFDAPSGVHVDRARGRVYISDTYNSVVRVVWE